MNMNQSTLNRYFKIKNKTFNAMDKGLKRKFSLSLSKTPNKSPKLKNENENVHNIIDLVSDDDEESTSLKTNEINQSFTSSSESTLLYTPETLSKSPVTPSSSQKYSHKASSTPSSLKSASEFSPISCTPSKKLKFYSPTKKRGILDRTPTKVKRNLSYTLSPNSSQSIFSSEDFLQLSQDVDDKTMFLLKIIYQFLHDENLKSLLSETSCSLLSNVNQIKKPGVRLVCRLYWQQDGWYRWEKVKKIMSDKAEVDDPTIHEAIRSLIECGFIVFGNSNNGQEIDFEELVKMLKLDELKCICKDLKIKATRKDDIVQSLRSYCKQKTIANYFTVNKSSNEDRLLKLLRSKAGSCYKLSHEARNTLKELYCLMYLGIDYNIIKEKKLELMLLYEKSNKETYPVPKDMEIDNASLVFKNREQFLGYINACSIYEDLEAATETIKKCEIIEKVYNLYNEISTEDMMSYMTLSAWLQRYTPGYIYVKILENGIQELKKAKVENEKYITLAVKILSMLINQNIFRQHKRSEWYSEKALILDKYLHSSNEAAEVLLEGFNSNLSEELQDCMRPRAKLLAKRQKNPIKTSLRTQLLIRAEKSDILEKNIKAKHIYKQPMYNPIRGKIKFETRTEDGILVHEAEEYCIYHYIKEGKYTHGGHWEGRIVTTIFFLLFWDIIYARLPGVRGIFLSYYQSYPLDMFSDSFYTNRKSLIEAKLKEIEESSIEDILSKMQDVWDNRPETELSGVQRNIGWEAVRAVAACLAPRRLAALCRRLAAHYRHAHSGFPDLALWHQHTGQIAFMEVKTDTDKPSMKQIQWMHYMKQHDINAEFCYVGVNTAGARSRNTDDLDDCFIP